MLLIGRGLCGKACASEDTAVCTLHSGGSEQLQQWMQFKRGIKAGGAPGTVRFIMRWKGEVVSTQAGAAVQVHQQEASRCNLRMQCSVQCTLKVQCCICPFAEGCSCSWCTPLAAAIPRILSAAEQKTILV